MKTIKNLQVPEIEDQGGEEDIRVIGECDYGVINQTRDEDSDEDSDESSGKESDEQSQDGEKGGTKPAIEEGHGGIVEEDTEKEDGDNADEAVPESVAPEGESPCTLLHYQSSTLG